MMKFSAIYRCGHTLPVTLFGPMAERETYLQVQRQRWCKDCFRRIAAAHGKARPKIHLLASNEIAIEGGYEIRTDLAEAGFRFASRADIPSYEAREADKWWKTLPMRDLPEKKVWVRHFESSAARDQMVEALIRDLGCRVPAAPTNPEASAYSQSFSYPLCERVASAQQIIRRALKSAKKPYIAFSGGKDSTVVAHLVRGIRPEVPLIWSDDELEYPESLDYMRTVEGLIVTSGFAQHAGWFSPWTDKPYWREPWPGTIEVREPMESWAPKQGYDLTFLGLRGDESKARGRWLAAAGPNYRTKTGRRSNPIHDWSHEDIWAYIDEAGIPYNEAYDMFHALDLRPELQRVGPLPLVPRATLAEGWPEMLARLECRYGQRWGR